MNFGRHHQGREILLLLHARAAHGAAAAPDAPPAVAVYDAAGAKVLSDLMPPLDRYKADGLFGYRLFLGADYPAGRYAVFFGWASGGTGRAKAGVFEVVAGGAPAGAVVSSYSLERPEALYLVQRTDGGKRYHRRNPHL